MIGLLVFSIIAVLLSFVLVLILPLLKVDIQSVKDYSTIFYNLAIGFGALLAGMSGLRYIDEYLSRLRLIKKKTDLQKRYPLSGLDINFHLVWFNGKLYLFDKDKKLFYHVHPYTTAEDLSFTSVGKRVNFDLDPSSQAPIKIDANELKVADYDNGGTINTTTL